MLDVDGYEPICPAFERFARGVGVLTLTMLVSSLKMEDVNIGGKLFQKVTMKYPPPINIMVIVMIPRNSGCCGMDMKITFIAPDGTVLSTGDPYEAMYGFSSYI